MARQNKDFLTQVREQAERTLAILTSEIRKREAELEKLLEQARVWRDALTSSFTPALLQTPPKKKKNKTAGRPAKRKSVKKTTRKASPAAKKATKKVAKKGKPAKAAAARATTAAAKKAPRAKKAGATKKAPKAKKAAPAKKASAGKRVDWDKLLASLPATFSIDDVMDTSGARSKGRNQVYPAINRWVNAKKARKVGTGRYKRIE
ncbi:MAG: hypothetical protein P8R42_22525 [Candidatus Binatia bacterium]|nr:hypothetical protein [Candidatus Binatia bacterium]